MDGRNYEQAVSVGTLVKRVEGRQDGVKHTERGSEMESEHFISWVAITDYLLTNWLTIINSFLILIIIPIINVICEHKLAKKMELYKSELNKDMEIYKIKLSIEQNKNFSFSKMEYEILREVWIKFIDLYYSFIETTSKIRSYPDVNMISEEELNSIIDRIEYINEYEKNTIRESKNKQQEINNAIDNMNIYKTYNVIHNCLKYIDSHSIFLKPSVKNEFDKIIESIRNILIDYEVCIKAIHRHPEKMKELYMKINKEIAVSKKKLEDEVQGILFPNI